MNDKIFLITHSLILCLAGVFLGIKIGMDQAIGKQLSDPNAGDIYFYAFLAIIIFESVLTKRYGRILDSLK